MYEYKAKVIKIVDGDTVDLLVELGFHIKAEERFRIEGLDTPEIWRPSCYAELEHGRAAKGYAEQLMPIGSFVTVQSSKLGIYGRWNGKITLSNGTDFTTEMIAHGFEKLDNYE